MRGPYAAQARLSRLSTQASSPRVLVVGIVLVELTWWMLGGGLYSFIYSGVFGTGSALEAVLSLAGFILFWISVALVMRLFQGRSWQVLISPLNTATNDFVAVVRWSGGLMLALAIFYLLPYLDQAVSTRPLWQWLLILPFALMATFIQTGGEELFFRGFLQSTLAARFESPIIWAVLPSIAFGLIHIPNATDVSQILQILLYTGVFGFFAADLTARTGTLGAAMGFHFAHNAVIFCLYALDTMPEAALSLWVFPDTTAGTSPEGAPIVTIAAVVESIWLLAELTLFWLAARIAIRA